MGTETKTGIGIGLVVCILAVGYFVFSDRESTTTDDGIATLTDDELNVIPPDKPAPKPPAKKVLSKKQLPPVAKKPTPAPAPSTLAKSPVKAPIKAPGDSTVTVLIKGDPSPSPKSQTPTPTPSAFTKGKTDVAKKKPAAAAGLDKTIVASKQIKPALQPDFGPVVHVPAKPEATIPPVLSGRITPLKKPLPAAKKLKQPGYYVVKAGDNGFWAVAENYYGDGKYMTLIERANPGVDSGHLRIGQRLRTPPIPPQAAAPKPSAPVNSLPAGGGRIYTVKKDDKGFWGIAQKEYGHGKYWPLIAEANKSLQAKKLKPGQELIIPPRPTGSTARRTATVKPPRPLKTDEKLYVVRKGDATGFWGIAKSQYGDASLHWAISAANPGVDSSRLRIGQTLILPPISSLRRAPLSDGTGESRRRIDVVASDDKPLFD